MNNNQIGNISESAIVAKYISLGYIVSIPFGNKENYDIIIDDGKKLKKIQIKTGHVSKESIYVNLGVEGKYKNCTAIAVYVPELNKCYEIPITKCKGTSITLHSNNVPNSTKYAKNFKL
jgi:hypothetical protein